MLMIKINYFMILCKIKVIAKILTLVITLFFANCNCYNSTIIKCTSAKLLYRAELVRSDNNQLFVESDSIGMFYCDNYTLYQIPIHEDFSTVNLDRNGNEINEKIIKEWTGFRYVVCNKNKPFAFRFDSLKAEKPKTVSIDSFLIDKTFKNFPFYQSDNDSLLQIVNVNHVLIEKHVNKVYKDKTDMSYPDTTFYYLKPGFENIDYSFSKKMDSIKKMKLFKVEFIFNEISLPNGTKIPKRVWVFELRNNDNYNKSNILKFVNQFRKKENGWSKEIK